MSGLVVDYDWTPSGLPDTVTYGAAATRTYGYDDAGRVVSDAWADASAATVASYGYGYDDDNNVTTKTVTLPGNALSGSHSYGYDYAGTLTSWTEPDLSTVIYGWDGAGNRLSAGGDVYSYDERNRLATGPAGVYAYSPRGDLASITGTGAATFTWDGLGRISTVDTGSTVAYSYDGFDRVATRNAASFTYAGLMPDSVSDGVHTYSRTPAGRVTAHDDGFVTSIVGLDRHGDVGFLATTGTGQVTDTRVYDPFGSVETSTGVSGITVGFQADWTDPTSGDVWMGARWYDPTSAMFRSRDTIAGELATPISLNRYTYGWANPLKYWDPDGRYVIPTPQLEDYGSTAGARAAATTTTAQRKRRADRFHESTDGANRDDTPAISKTTITPESSSELADKTVVQTSRRTANGGSVSLADATAAAPGVAYSCTIHECRPVDPGPTIKPTSRPSWWVSDRREDVVSFSEAASLVFGTAEFGATVGATACVAGVNPGCAAATGLVATGANVVGTGFDWIVAADSIYSAAFEGGSGKKAVVDFSAAVIGAFVPVSGRMAVRAAREVGDPLLEWVARAIGSTSSEMVDIARMWERE